MNIYFINRQSKLKGPFDVKNPLQIPILRIGDVCIRDTEEGVQFLLVVNNINRWNSCKCLDKAIYTETKINSNTLLFSFDGIGKRVGKIELLEWLSRTYKSEIIYKFFLNAIDILTYKCDYWDIELFVKIHAMNPIAIEHKHVCTTKESSQTNHHSFPLFYSYLEEDLQSLFCLMIEEGSSLREVYEYLRSKHAKRFREALRRFLGANPKSTIYDKR